MSTTDRLRPTERILLLVAALLALLAIGCGGGLQVTRLSSVRGSPSNVALFLSVERDGQPVTGLKPENFSISEDGIALSKSDAQVSLQPLAVGAVTHTLILVDRSGAGGGAIGSNELAAIEALAKRAAKLGKVGIYGFDGDDDIHAILPFSDEMENAPFGAVAAYTPKDASSNLHGAVLHAVEELESSLATEPEPLRFGALVVVAGGPDRAARKTLGDVTSALESDKHATIDVFAIAVGPGAAAARPEKIGRTASYQTGPELTTPAAIDKIGASLESRWKRYYLLSYCTPARKGEHKVRVEIKTGEPPVIGAMDYTFVADGMAAGCNPDRPPKFAGLDPPGEARVREEKLDAAGAASPPEKVAAAEEASKSDASDDDDKKRDKAGGKKGEDKHEKGDAKKAEKEAKDALKKAEKDDKGEKDKGDAKKGDKGDKDKGEKDKGDAKKGEKDKPEAKKPEPKKEEPKKPAPKPPPKKK